MNEEVVDGGPGVGNVGGSGILFEVHGYAVYFFIVEEVRHLSGVKNTVDVFQETLLETQM